METAAAAAGTTPPTSRRLILRPRAEEESVGFRVVQSDGLRAAVGRGLRQLRGEEEEEEATGGSRKRQQQPTGEEAEVLQGPVGVLPSC